MRVLSKRKNLTPSKQKLQTLFPIMSGFSQHTQDTMLNFARTDLEGNIALRLSEPFSKPPDNVQSNAIPCSTRQRLKNFAIKKAIERLDAQKCQSLELAVVE